MGIEQVANLLRVYDQSTERERNRGLAYYLNQRAKILDWTEEVRLISSRESRIAAFCVLSPNNAEKTTYTDLIRCARIVAGRLPESTKTSAYPVNKDKALRLLRGEPPESVIGGRKVTAFFHNTLDPDNSEHVTIDGHMYSVWVGERLQMRQVPYLGERVYARISDDVRDAAEVVGIPAPKLQSTLWLTWKRMNRVLYSGQMELEFVG